MAEENKPDTEPEHHDFGVRFEKNLNTKSNEKLGPEVYEAANRHLAPTDVPGHKEDVFNVTRVFTDDALEMGTIVSDKKRRRSSFSKNIKSAFKEWWGRTRSSLIRSLNTLEKRLPEEVPEQNPVDRTETIKKAVQHATLPPKGERHVELEKSKTFQKDVQRVRGVPYYIKNVPEKKPVWKTGEENSEQSHPQTRERRTTKIETPDMRGTMVAPIIGKHIKKSSYPPRKPGIVPLPKNDEAVHTKIKERPREILERKIEKPLAPSKQTKEQEAKHPPVSVFPNVTKHSAYTAPISSEKEVSQQEEVQIKNSVSQMPETPPPKEETATSLKQEATTVEEARERLASQYSFTAPDPTPTTRTFEPPEQDKSMSANRTPPSHEVKPVSSWGPLFRIVGVVLIVGLAVVLMLYAILRFDIFGQDSKSASEVSPAAEPVAVPAFFTPDTQTPIVFSGTAREFLSTLREGVAAAPSGVTQFYPTERTETGERIPSAREMLGLISSSNTMPRNMLHVLNDISMFGAVMTTTVNEPFIIFRSYNFDVLFAGLLAWERSMYDDLSFLFEAAGTGHSPSASFTDAVRNNASIRILYDESGEEILLYAIVNRNTVIITSSTEALARIIERL